MATINDFGIPDIGTGILQPKLKNKYRVMFNSIGYVPASQGLSIQAIQVARPSLSFEEVELHRYNSRAWVAGKHNWEECAIVFEDDITGQAATIIQQQLQKQQWLIGSDPAAQLYLATAGNGAVYKFQTIIETLDGNTQPLETWTLEGCWLKQTNWNEMAYADNESMKINISIRFDHARQVIHPYGGGRPGDNGNGYATSGGSV
jgi:hypothetical protein